MQPRVVMQGETARIVLPGEPGYSGLREENRLVTASLPPDVQAVFDRFITTELTTVDSAGQPITWPVTPYYRPGDPCIDVTTGLGYPKKANDAQANPLVSLLFSDPTGSGLRTRRSSSSRGRPRSTTRTSRPTASATRARWSRSCPGLARWDPPDQFKRFLSWYFTRIYIHVRPERIYVWRADEEPELYDAHMEEVRSGPLRGARAVPRRARGRRERLASPDPATGRESPNRRPVVRIARRLPVRDARRRSRPTRPTAASGSRRRRWARRSSPVSRA